MKDAQRFPTTDWQAEVAAGRTQSGYVDWLDSKLDDECVAFGQMKRQPIATLTEVRSTAHLAKRLTDAEIVANANALARVFYKCQGCQVPEGYRFDRALHPRERMCWQMAVAAFAELRDTDVEDALSNLEDE